MPPIHTQPLAIRIAPNVYARGDARKQLIDREELIQNIVDKWGRCTYLESYEGKDLITATFDHDKNYATLEEAEEDWVKFGLECVEKVKYLMDSTDLGLTAQEKEYVTAVRYARRKAHVDKTTKQIVEDEGYKVGFRTYFPNVQIRACDLKQLLEAKFGADTKTWFDTSIYTSQAKGHLMYCIGTRKEETTEVVAPCSFDLAAGSIQRLDPPYPHGELDKYLMQYKHENQKLIKLPARVTARQPAAGSISKRNRLTSPQQAKQRARRPGVCEAPSAELTCPFVDPMSRLQTTEEDVVQAGSSYEQHVQQCMEQHSQGYRLSKVEGSKCTFIRNSDDSHCPNGQHHSNNNSIYVKLMSNGQLQANCRGNECKDQKVHIGDWQPTLPPAPAGSDQQFSEEWLNRLASEFHAFDQCFEYMNKFHIHFLSSQPQVYRLQFDEDGGIVSVHKWSTQQFILNFGNTCTKAMRQWLETPERRKMYQEVYYPIRDPPCAPDQFNLFMGHACAKSALKLGGAFDADVIQYHLDFLLSTLCNGCTDTYEYMLSWMAFIVQTGKKTQTVPVFVSLQGVGKGSFFDAFFAKAVLGGGSDSLGRANSWVGNEADLVFGQFNGTGCMRQFVLLDDCSSLKPEHMQRFVQNVTSLSENVQYKHRTAFVHPTSHLNYMMHTNHNDFVKLDPSDRRFLIIKCDSSRANDHPYIGPIYTKAAEVAPHFYNYLMARDISGWDPQNQRPMSTEMLNARRLALDPVAKYLLACLDEGSIITASDGSDSLESMAWPAPRDAQQPTIRQEYPTSRKDDIFSGYKLWCSKFEQHRCSSVRSLTAFTQALGRVAAIRGDHTLDESGQRKKVYLWPAKEELVRRMKAAKQWVD